MVENGFQEMTMTHDGLTHGIAAPDHCHEAAAGTGKQARNGLPRHWDQALPAAAEELMNHTQRDSSP